MLCTSAVPGLTDLSARGPAARYVWDLADRDNSLWVVPFGASGVPGSAHHRDQLPLWLEGALVPVRTDWNRLTEEREPAPHDTPESVRDDRNNWNGRNGRNGRGNRDNRNKEENHGH